MKFKNKFLLGAVMSFALISLAGCYSNDDNSSKSANNTKTSSETKKVESITSDVKKDLEKYKNTKVGDNSAVSHIVRSIPGNVYVKGISLETEKEPYGIVVNYDPGNNEKEYNEFWKADKVDDILRENANEILSLVSNAEYVEFNVKGIGNQNYKYCTK